MHRAEVTSTIHFSVVNPTVRLALTYVAESAGHRATVHRDISDFVVADLASARWIERVVDVLVVDSLPLPCQAAIDAIVDGRARAAITTDEPEQLGLALSSARLGVVTVPRSLIERANALPRLPERLDTTLRCLVAGHTTMGIARQLRQSESTVKRDISALLRHFGAANRQSLPTAATAAGFNLTTS